MRLMLSRLQIMIFAATPLWIVGWHYGLNTSSTALLWVSTSLLTLNAIYIITTLFNWAFIKPFKKKG